MQESKEPSNQNLNENVSLKKNEHHYDYIGNKRKVNFASDVKDYQRPITSDQMPKKELRCSRIFKKVLNLLVEEKNFERVTELLEPYTEEQKNHFFLKEGRCLLSWSLTFAKTGLPLEYLLEIIPKEIVESAIIEGDISIFQIFIGGKSEADKDNRLTEEGMNLLIEKTKKLLAIKSTIIEDVLDYILQLDRITQKIKERLKLIKSSK
jgi:hypothetical protein